MQIFDSQDSSYYSLVRKKTSLSRFAMLFLAVAATGLMFVVVLLFIHSWFYSFY